LRHKLPVTILAQGCKDSPTPIVQLKSQCRTVDRASEMPHQFRTRNNLIRTQQTRSKSNKNAAKSTNLIDILPPHNGLVAGSSPAGPTTLRPTGYAWRSQAETAGRSVVSGVAGAKRKRRRTGCPPNQNIENNPMQSSEALFASVAAAKTF
jgi:hypothetical protein